MKKSMGTSLLAGAFVAILGLAGCASHSGEKTGAYADDAWITSKVKSEMAVNKSVKARDISVNTSGGVVTLSGTADSWEESNKAAEIARGVKGVKSVENDIQVK
jgi:osmotically-inducible protein OsmY